ncbi:RNA-binding protein 28-like [Oppia nitens]|uniref:RNA-binding protein 28-like n=1 Tax=Oppia nitens TaxID=1686743 RepID=UPI0023DC464D|nr:RNA-binding protein 28-like [Oppia nitens]
MKDMSTKTSDDIKLDKKKKKAFLKTKKSRIIVRNLSFKANEDILRKEFKKFGEILEIQIPKKSDGKMLGFAFVGFATIKSALLAIKGMNAKQIVGRPVAVDFAVAKKRFQSQHKKEESTDDNNNNNGKD